MANLIVRNLDQRVVAALKQKAARDRRSAEAEHRHILEQALLVTNRKPLATILAAMPDVGQDEDFERQQDNQTPRVSD